MPFRAEDARELVRETTQGKVRRAPPVPRPGPGSSRTVQVEFHERYWKNVNPKGKDFIRSLLQARPAPPAPSFPTLTPRAGRRDEAPDGERGAQRPRARPPPRACPRVSDSAQWLTTHEASTEHDLGAGLRENFNPRARWRAAIGAVRAAGRFKVSPAPSLSASRRNSEDSGNWASGAEDGGEERKLEDVPKRARRPELPPPPPYGDTNEHEHDAPSQAEETAAAKAEAHLEDEQHGRAPPHQPEDEQRDRAPQQHDDAPDPTPTTATRPPVRFSADPTHSMPGSFDFGSAHHHNEDGEGEGGFFAKLTAHFGKKSPGGTSASSSTGAS